MPQLTSDEKTLDPINDTLNPERSKFGMPWYVILGLITVSVALLVGGLSLRSRGCEIVGLLLTPTALGFSFWLCHKDVKEPLLIWYDLCQPAELDPGK